MLNFDLEQGSSVPIPIGMAAGKWKKDAEGPSARDTADDQTVAAAVAAGELQYSGTFIPPHQLSLAQDSFLPIAGSMRKDRLRARTAILKATGFVENMPGVTVRCKACGCTSPSPSFWANDAHPFSS